MNETLNHDLFLLLKQQLVIAELVSLNAAVKIDGIEVDINELEKSIVKLVTQIDQDMTPPIALLAGRKVKVDVRGLANELSDSLSRYYGGQGACNPERIAFLVHKCPRNDEVIDLCNLEEYANYDKEDVTTLLVQVTRITDAVRGFRKANERSLGGLLVLVNFMQIVDMVFETTNERYGV